MLYFAPQVLKKKQKQIPQISAYFAYFVPTLPTMYFTHTPVMLKLTFIADVIKVSFFQKDLLVSLDSPKKQTNEFVFSTQTTLCDAKPR